jgi:threonine dehydrogenase-like Zn-dependent dehydrogenase
VGRNVTDVQPGDYVVATVRRPGSSIYDLIGTNDMTTDDVYLERGINLRHGFLTEYDVDDAAFIVKVPRGLREVGVLLEPLTVVEKGIARDLAQAEAEYAGWLGRLLTHPVKGLENYRELAE